MTETQTEVVQRFWEGLSDADRAEMLASERPSSKTLHQMLDAGVWFTSDGKWEGDTTGWQWSYPPLLLEILERER